MSIMEEHLRQQCDDTLNYTEQDILPELDKLLKVTNKIYL